MSKKKAKILYVTHCYHNRGGVEAHTKALEIGLREHFETFVVFPEGGSLYLKSGDSEALFPADPAVWPVTPYHAPNTEASLKTILEKVQPDLIHVQHFLHWHLGLLDQLSSFGVPVAISFHEYYLITPHFTMQGAETPFETYTKEYSMKFFNADISEYLQQRKTIFIKSLANFPHQIVPSKFLALELAKVFPREYLVIPHGIEAFQLQEKTKAPHNTLRFGYLGSLIQQKGWESLLAAFRLVRARHPNCEMHFYGGGAGVPEEMIEGVVFHGVYDQEDLPRIFASIDIGVIPSVFRETFSYVLSEMRHAGLAVAASNIGALSERIENGKNGKLFVPGDTQSIVETLSWFLENDSWRAWNIPKPRLIGEMLDEYRSLYEGALSR